MLSEQTIVGHLHTSLFTTIEPDVGPIDVPGIWVFAIVLEGSLSRSSRTTQPKVEVVVLISVQDD
jgi:hypothetical protein